MRNPDRSASAARIVDRHHRGRTTTVPPAPGTSWVALTAFMAGDHARLDALLHAAVATPGRIDHASFDPFRTGLLRHIALEEKVLLIAACEARGEPLPMARSLRIEHGALASLLVPSPTPQLVEEIRSILVAHNAAEEGPGGLYAVCDELLAGRAASLLERLRAYPPVKVARYRDGPRVHRTAAEALAASAGQLERAESRTGREGRP